MRSLFLQIFLWFWFAMVLVVLTLLISSSYSESRNSRERDEAMDRSMSPLVADNFAEVFDREGPAGFSGLLARGKGAFPWTPYLFDPAGAEALGRSVSPQAREAFRLALGSRNTEVVHSGGARWVGQWVQATSGKPYVVVLEVNLRPPNPFLRAPSQVQLLRFLVALLIVGAISLWITRHITSPILQLREAANQLAQGNLAARVGSPSLLRADELGEFSKDFNHMAEQLERLITSRQRLISDVSHELRSPLARLSVALGIAQRSASPESSPVLVRIEREAQRLNELIAELLRLARLESGAERIRWDNLDLEALIREVANDANFEASSQNRSVRVSRSCPCQVVGNSDLLRSAFENVVRNAVDYTPDGGEVDLSLASSDDGRLAVIRVRDHGPGVPTSALQSIFEPFYRVENARERTRGGSGLGLSITDRAIRAHGGSVYAHNARDGGLVVEMSLPSQSPGAATS
jgi:two-component system, OmpR family, sensor histidine kinase CpxA